MYRAKYFNSLAEFSAQEKPPILLFLSSRRIWAYYSRLVSRGAVNGQSCIWTFILVDYLFMAGAKLGVNAMDYTSFSRSISRRLYNSENSSLPWFVPDKTAEALQYLILYKFE